MLPTDYYIHQDMETGEFYIIVDQNYMEKIIIDNDKYTEECRWVIEDKEDLVDRLITRISESNKDREIMKTDLKYLMKLEDMYIFSSTDTNEYIAKSDNEKRFSELCQDFITYKTKYE
jgi:hypothetical protein